MTITIFFFIALIASALAILFTINVEWNFKIGKAKADAINKQNHDEWLLQCDEAKKNNCPSPTHPNRVHWC